MHSLTHMFTYQPSLSDFGAWQICHTHITTTRPTRRAKSPRGAWSMALELLPGRPSGLGEALAGAGGR